MFHQLLYIVMWHLILCQIENPVHLARALDDAAKNASEFLKEDVSLSATLLGRVVADRKALRKPAVSVVRVNI